ncbi:Cc8L18.2-like protein [Elysia marginata]|uniref:Cc8L18.2-like protein n=1 Tax=Elysia marginata TaxID=1093978 RepID=A0AAV4I790_9GAST|nr:Cc8L18.2-like protein [Elysia marginata]
MCIKFLSDDITHDYHAVHQFTLKSIDLLRKDAPVKEVILWSDGAAPQYKGKGSFADVTLYPFKCQRNYFGSKHGKGEADSETGRFARALKRAVAKGQGFRNAEEKAVFGRHAYPNNDPLKK